MVLKIGTDCSGIEAPIQALIRMNVPFEHEFSSEIDKFARKSIKANYSCKILFEDMTKPRELPKIDIYVCGFPCQPFSYAGDRKGSEDRRANIFLHCVEAIKKSEPSIFILENVPGIMTVEKGKYFGTIKETLKELTDYSVNYWVLNTKNYGVPQNRKRLFMVGLKNDKIKKPIKIPEVLECKPIESYIDYTTTHKDIYSETCKKMYEQFKDGIFVNVGSLYRTSANYRVNPLYSSTITCHPALWCVPMHRKATMKELLSLQGFPKDFKQVVSDTQMRKQIGNSMTVDVLVCIFKECFSSISLNC